jgi:small subunit ribosomal protein S16
MAVSIRLARYGGKKKPFYRIVAIEKSRQRDGSFIENLGTYDPKIVPPTIQLANDRYDYWLSVGAKPSDTVASLVRRSRVPAKA